VHNAHVEIGHVGDVTCDLVSDFMGLSIVLQVGMVADYGQLVGGAQNQVSPIF
jgi:hypothetical protein